MTTERKATIRRAASDVFALLVDVDRLCEWRDNLVSIQRVGPPGPIDGARFRETMSTPFGLKSATVQLSTEPPQKFSFRVIDGPVRPRGTIMLRERGEDMTEVIFRVWLAPLFALPTLADTVASTFLKSSLDKSLARLKAILEAEPLQIPQAG